MTNSFSESNSSLLTGQISCVEIVQEFLNNIYKQGHLNAFVEVYPQEALNRAKSIDKKIREKQDVGRLAGAVIGIKDLICYRNHKVSAASRMLHDFESQISATVVERLLKEDAIIIGRQNCDEFGMGSANENSTYGPVLNPISNDRVPGGSSGGSAAAVVANLCHISIGSDTGGSVRQPASFCGTYGLKPTYGRISRWGLIAYASSFDQIGIIANHPEDIAKTLEVIAGSDSKDHTSSQKKVDNYSQDWDGFQPYKIGYIKEAIEHPGLTPLIQQKLWDKLKQFQQAGHIVTEVTFPLLSYLVPCYYILTTAEASSNLSRYDGIRYGYRAAHNTSLQEIYKKSRSEGFGKEVKKRLLLGTFVLSAGYQDAFYIKATKVRRMIQNQTLEALSGIDFLCTPSAPSVAYKLGDNKQSPIKRYLGDIYTVHASLAGIPAISMPLDLDQQGLPFGFQLMAKPFAEKDLLRFSYQNT